MHAVKRNKYLDRTFYHDKNGSAGPRCDRPHITKQEQERGRIISLHMQVS